jgi:hypothetical protein
LARRTHTAIAAATCVLATAGLAAAAAGDAQRCHPDLSGTRSLTVRGNVTSYAFGNGSVIVDWARSNCAGTAVWEYAARSRATASASCRRAAAPTAPAAETRLVAAQGNRMVRVVLAPRSVDRPDRLDVLDRATHARLASWPLFDRPARVALYGNIAILSAADRHALYAVRISDGRIAMLGIARAGDRPLIGPQGVVYQDDLDLYMHRTAPDRVTLKLVPLATVRREFDAPEARRVVTGRVNAISMDGKRVAFAVHDPSGACDRVLFWSIPWHFVSRLTQRVGPTCLPTHAPGGITGVAVAGDRAVWTTSYGGRTRVLAASIINCVEWVVSRPVPGVRDVAALAGDGSVLAYALDGATPGARTSSRVERVPLAWRPVGITASRSRIAGLSADGGRVAVLYRDGTVRVVGRTGRTISRLAVGEARATALRRGRLAVLRPGRLEVYRIGSKRPDRSWHVPLNATSVDLVYGIAVVTAGRDVLALNVTTGRTALLLRAPGRVAAQIEEPGAVAQYNVGERGVLRFIPMRVVEARVR